jgi:hypothetical protein
MSERLGFVRVRNCVAYLLTGSPLLQLGDVVATSADLAI